MTKLRALLAAAAAAVVGVSCLGGAADAQIKERTVRFAFQNTMDHPQGMGAAKFAEIVKAKSGGKINVRLFPAGQLGGDLQTVSALQGGTMDMTVLNAGLLVGINKEFAVLDFPFLFETPQEADVIVDGPIGKKLHGLVVGKGLIGLGYWELGYRHVTNNIRPITKIEDMKGLKIRVLQSPLFIDMFSALGTNPVPMPWPEVYTALEQRVVDGQENPYTHLITAKLAEVQKYVSATKHIYNAQSLLVSKKTWDTFSDEEKKLMQSAADEATTWQRATSRKVMEDVLTEVATKTQTKWNDITPTEMARFREAVKPVVAKYAKEVGEGLYVEINDQLTKMRKK
jgi:tripartite ATP-independent transporter DctP family solute receptor